MKRILLVLAALLVAPATASATPLPVGSLGINFTGSPPNLATASAAGVGLARDEVIEGSNTDAVVELTAAAHLRLYPMLGIPKSQGASADATTMASFVTSFAQRYGRGGSFWAQHPELPYLPVESYEIGNEPDITPTAPADETSLHYADPADFALVYETSRMALHQVDPAAQAVVGGVLDSGSITLADAERYLAAIGPADAIGYHPYLYNVTTMERDTQALRQWLDASGHAGVPIDINEFGAPTSVSDWGTQVAQYTQWALCTPGLGIEDVQAFWWGGVPIADTDPWASMTSSGLAENPLGAAYLGEVQSLTTQGCPVPPPPVVTPPAPPPPAPKHHKPHRRHHKRRRFARVGFALITLRVTWSH